MVEKLFKLLNFSIDNFFKANSLMTDNIKIFDITTEKEEINNQISTQNYDIILVKNEKQKIGYIHSDEFQKKDKKTTIRNISNEEKIDQNTTLTTIINKFKKCYYLFVFKNNKFKGIITYADLNRSPIQVFCFIY